MNLVLLDAHELTGDRDVAVVRGPRARHIHAVHRAAVGDTLRVGLVDGLVGEGVVTAIAPDEVSLRVRLFEPPPGGAGVDLLLALPRPKMLRRLLAAIASMGIKRIVLVNSARVEKSYFDSPLLLPAAIDEALRLGLAQARDTVLPEVRFERRFRPFVEDQLEACWPDSAQRLLAHPVAAGGLADVWRSPGSHATVIAIGPEGGWVPFEVDLLEARRFQRFSAGSRILRVDTVVPFLVGQCALLSGAAPAP